jgi:hypothetical protein
VRGGGWLVIALFICSCGSGDKKGPTEPGSGGGDVVEERAGVVYLLNKTPYPLRVAFLSEVDAEDIFIVRTTVAVGLRVMISGGELPAGHFVEFDIVLEVPAEFGPRVRRKASVRIDGERVLRAYLQEADAPFSLLVEGP